MLLLPTLCIPKDRSWPWLTVDVLDDGEPVSCNNSLQQNKISYKSQRKALWGRHPIPPSFQQSSTRHAGIKETGLRGQESKGDWDAQRRDEGGRRRKRERMNAWSIVSRKLKEKKRLCEYRGFSPLYSLHFSLWQCSSYLLRLLPSRWNGREMGS